MGGSGEDGAGMMDVDPAGNVYTTGSFTGTATFGTTTLTAVSANPSFLAKHTPDGTLVFVEQFGVDSQSALDVTAGGIHLTGWFGGTVDADPGSGQHLLTTSNTYESMFLIKLDLNGNYMWSFGLTGSRYSNTYGMGVTVDSAGSIYVSGVFHDQVDFDPSSGKALLSGGDAYVAKYSSSGAYVWAKALTLNGGRPQTIKLDGSGNIYFAGWFSGTADFDPGKTTVNRTSAGSADGFVLKLNASGNFSSVWTFGGTGWDSVEAIAIDTSGRVYLFIPTNGGGIVLTSLN
jgi:hypothetical protein